ncbi:PEF-CTERM sorting domain-containing protein [Methanosarcina sp.]|uniref:PEF-CTERM sorting domain-containing protein n=1 Tax=Methanosarcina sp. TaxID=2213 RepID=UPI002CA92F9C|nr:PEF-CTERM sorting domain-containing protein [Methanosarcina sp.]HOW13965.1 PEF-CTERM sorting domain-containing protein [Methanosarcina sp.]
MRLKFIIGILALLLLTVSTASAETFYLTDVNEEQFAGKIRIQVSCSGDTITVQDVSTDLNTISNVDLKEIGIVLPAGYSVTSVVDEGAENDWSATTGSYEESEFGHFNTQINRDPGSNSKTRGPIKIYLNKALAGSLPANEYGNSVVVHISFGEKGEALVGSTWVSGYTPIPEFPSIALPVVAILGIMFIFGRRKQE